MRPKTGNFNGGTQQAVFVPQKALPPKTSWWLDPTMADRSTFAEKAKAESKRMAGSRESGMVEALSFEARAHKSRV